MVLTKIPAIVADLDGTLADATNLRDYIEGRDRNFDAFYEASLFCPPIQWVIDDLHRWSSTHQVIIVTARQRKYLDWTSDWLVKHRVPYSGMMMRRTGDQRPDYEVKKEMLQHLLREYDIRHAYDDNPNTYKLWLEHQIPTTIVPGWPMESWGHYSAAPRPSAGSKDTVERKPLTGSPSTIFTKRD